MKKLLLLLTILSGLLTGLQAQTVTIGNGTGTSLPLPMNCYYGYTYSQSIYYQSEIMAGMTINKIAYQYTGNSWTDADVKVYMGHTAKTVFTSDADWVPLTELTEVYSGAITVIPGWVELTLTTPFVYNGTGNLVVAFDENTTGYHGSSDDFYSTETSGINRSINFHNDSNNPDPAAPPAGTLRAGYANIQLIAPASGPSFNITPSSNNYGTLPLNTTKPQNFSIKNNGIGFLDIAEGNITITGADAESFILGTVTYPIHLAASETATIPVTFAPLTGGNKTSSLHIVDNVTKTVHDIALSGSGYMIPGLPFSENFDGATFPPLYWQKCKGALTATSILETTPYGWMAANFCNVAANGKSANATLYGTSVKDWLITSSINLGAAPGNMILKFNAGMTLWGDVLAPMQNGVDDKFVVVISPDDGVTWSTANILRQYDNAPGSTHKLNRFSTTATAVSIDFSGYSGLVKLGFYIESSVNNAENDIFVDNLLLESSSAIGENNLITSDALLQNYPNPFNPTTAISYQLSAMSDVQLAVYNAKGELVKTLVNGRQNAGSHSVSFDGAGFNSGIYFYKLEADGKSMVKRMMMMK